MDQKIDRHRVESSRDPYAVPGAVVVTTIGVTDIASASDYDLWRAVSRETGPVRDEAAAEIRKRYPLAKILRGKTGADADIWLLRLKVGDSRIELKGWGRTMLHDVYAAEIAAAMKRLDGRVEKWKGNKDGVYSVTSPSGVITRFEDGEEGRAAKREATGERYYSPNAEAGGMLGWVHYYVAGGVL